MSWSATRAFGFTFVAQLIVNLQGLIALPIIIRGAGEATYGAYVVFWMGMSQVFDLLTNGFSYSYIRNLVSARSAMKRKRLFEPQFTYSLAICGILSVLVVSAFPNVWEGQSAATPWLMASFLAATLVSRQVLYYFRYTLRFSLYNFVFGATPVLFIGLLAVVTVTGHRLSLDALIALQSIAVAAVSLPLVPVMLRDIGVPRLHLSWRVLQSNIRLGLPLALGTIVDFALSFSDRYLIALFLSVADVGRYQPAYQFSTVILFLPRWISTILTPTLSRMVDRGDQVAAESAVDGCIVFFLMFAVPFIVGMTMVGPSLLALLINPDVAAAACRVIPFVALALTFDGIFSFMNSVTIAANRLRATLGAMFVGAGLNVCLNLILLPFIPDLAIPAVTTLIGYAIAAAYAIVRLRAVWRLHIRMIAILRFAGASAIMAGLLWLLGYRPASVFDVSWYYLLATVACSIVVYFLALAAMGGVGKRELLRMSALVRHGALASEQVG